MIERFKAEFADKSVAEMIAEGINLAANPNKAVALGSAVVMELIGDSVYDMLANILVEGSGYSSNEGLSKEDHDELDKKQL